MADIVINIAASLVFLASTIYFENLLSGIFFGLLSFLGLFIVNPDKNSKLNRLKTIAINYFKVDFHYLKITLTLAIYFYLTSIINQDLSLIISFILLMNLLKLDNRASFITALVFLTFYPLLIIFQRKDLAEITAIYAYYFLVIGLIGQIIDISIVKKIGHNLLKKIPPLQLSIISLIQYKMVNLLNKFSLFNLNPYYPKSNFIINSSYNKKPSLFKCFYLLVFNPIICLIKDIRPLTISFPRIQLPKTNLNSLMIFFYRSYLIIFNPVINSVKRSKNTAVVAQLHLLHLYYKFISCKNKTFKHLKTNANFGFNLLHKLININYFYLIFGPIIEVIQLPKISLSQLTIPKIKLPKKDYLYHTTDKQLPKIKIRFPKIKVNVRFYLPSIQLPQITLAKLVQYLRLKIGRLYLSVFEPIISIISPIKLPKITFFNLHHRVITEVAAWQLPQIKIPPPPSIPFKLPLDIFNNNIAFFCFGAISGLIIILIYPNKQNVKLQTNTPAPISTVSTITKDDRPIINVVGESEEKINPIFKNLQHYNQDYRLTRKINQEFGYYQSIIIYNPQNLLLAQKINADFGNRFLLTKNPTYNNEAVIIYIK